MKRSTARVEIVGAHKDTQICQKILNSLQALIRADSKRPSEILIANCRTRKIPKAFTIAGIIKAKDFLGFLME